jgi:hypothetical protein
MSVQTKFFRNHDAAARDETKRGSCKYRKTYTTAVNVKITVFWDVMHCSLLERYHGRTCCPASSE